MADDKENTIQIPQPPITKVPTRDGYQVVKGGYQPLNEGYQPVERGHQPDGAINQNQTKPPQGGSGVPPKQLNDKKE